MILANGCNITKSEKFKGVWILSVPTVCIYIHPVQPVCTSLFLLLFIKSTVYCIAHCTLYLFFICIYFFTYIYIYSLVLCYVFCTVHWADLTWFTFHYWLYSVYLSMWRIKEPWTLNMITFSNTHTHTKHISFSIAKVGRLLLSLGGERNHRKIGLGPTAGKRL